MSGLQLATKTDGPATDAPASTPPPVPPSGPQHRDLGSHTQEDFSLPSPGSSPQTGSAPPSPPPPPPPSCLSALPQHAEIIAPDEEGGSKLGVGLAVILVLGVLGTGGWYIYGHFGAKGAIMQTVNWPAIQLTGMVDATNIGDASSAILNGNLVALNHRIDGATLVEVTSDGVVLELHGEHKTIRIGESTL